MTRHLTLALIFAGVLALAGCNGAQERPVYAEATTPTDNPTSVAPDENPVAEVQENGAETPADAPKDAAAKEQPGATSPRPNNDQPRASGQGGNNPNRQQGGGGMRGGGAMSLALREDVRKELGITDEQVEKLRTKMREIVPQPNDGERPNVNPEEVAKKMEEAAKSILSAAQIKRLGELQLQREGPTALARKEVADKVGLSGATRAKIEGMVQTHSEKMREQFSSRPENQEAAQKRSEEIRKSREKLRADILALLSADQKSKWEALLGKPFEFQEGAPRAGGNFVRPQVDRI